MIHLRNGRAKRHPSTFGEGITWCGKKLLGKPEQIEPAYEIFNCYGIELHVTDNPASGSCPRCVQAFNSAYIAAFPEGTKPIATIHFDNPEEIARARAALSPEALTKHFGPNGGGIEAITAALKGAAA